MADADREAQRLHRKARQDAVRPRHVERFLAAKPNAQRDDREWLTLLRHMLERLDASQDAVGFGGVLDLAAFGVQPQKAEALLQQMREAGALHAVTLDGPAAAVVATDLHAVRSHLNQAVARRVRLMGHPAHPLLGTHPRQRAVALLREHGGKVLFLALTAVLAYFGLR